MATYKQLSYGSKGSDVTELQKLLNQNGYSLSVDGSYGPKTQAAVTDYQSKNGLKVDGVAGSQTWGALTAAQGSTNTQTQAAAAAATPEKSYRYDADKDAVYQQALQALEGVKAEKPVYAGTFDQQVQEIYDQVMSQKDFTYDLNGDALWQQYKDQYTTQGRLAMMDTMGQAAALTGGYGSSYAQNAGQQAYQGYLQQLNDRVPELYQLALSKYNNDQAQLQNKLSAAQQMQADEYSKYQDALDLHYAELDRAQSAADAAYDRGNSAWLTEEQLRREDEETAYGRQQDSYNNLANLISSTGYTPSQSELKQAGMSDTQAAAYAAYYDQQQKAAKVSSGSRSVKSAEPEDTDYVGIRIGGSGSLSSDKIRLIQWSLGVDATGVWDQQTADASGYDNSNECYDDWINGKVVNGKEWTSYYLPQMQAANAIKAKFNNVKTDAEREALIADAYEAGKIDETMAQELLREAGLV